MPEAVALTPRATAKTAALLADQRPAARGRPYAGSWR
jgi:hypothetical protein